MDSSTPFRLPRKTPFGIGENVAEWATGLSQLDKFYAQRPTPSECGYQNFLAIHTGYFGYRLSHCPWFARLSAKARRNRHCGESPSRLC